MDFIQKTQPIKSSIIKQSPQNSFYLPLGGKLFRLERFSCPQLSLNFQVQKPLLTPSQTATLLDLRSKHSKTFDTTSTLPLQTDAIKVPFRSAPAG